MTRPLCSRLARAAAVLLVALAACSGDEHAGHEHAGHSGAMPGMDDGGSLAPIGVVPDFLLTDQTGAPFARAQLAGSYWVADFIFTRCTEICPRLTARMAELQAQLRAVPHGRDVRLVSFSVDPEYDRPEVLAEYAARHDADTALWTFATGERDAIWELSKQGFLLPVGEAPAGADMPLFHSDRFVLVDPEGALRGFYPAMDGGAGVEKLLADLRSLREAS